MGFRINTNVAAMNSHVNATMTNKALDSSLSKLSSGLRINSAADDASGMAIADSLRSQANGLGQAIRNANDGMSIVQIADKAMDEQIKILDTIKVKAIQAAQDGQSGDSRKALQADITRLMEQLDNIANTTAYNGQQLLSGQFTNKSFQIGAYSNQTVNVSIGATSSDKIGQSRFETGTLISAANDVTLTFSGVAGGADITLESVTISTGAGTGLGVLAEVINKSADKTGIRASYAVQETGEQAVASGTISGLEINGVAIGSVTVDNANDSGGQLVAAINAVTDSTGVVASVDSRGYVSLTSVDGRGIKISGTNLDTVAGLDADAVENYGRLSLTRLDGKDIAGISGANVGFSATAEATVNLRELKGAISADVASAMGFNANSNAENITEDSSAGVTTLKGAQATITIAETSQKMLDRVRADLGSVQNQLESTIRNISVTQVNVASAESQIRDVDFAAESANFAKLNILAQSGSYAMSQANAVQQNVMRLLQ